MIFNATVTGSPTEAVQCRVFNPSESGWWNGVSWVAVEDAQLTTIPYIGGDRFSGPVGYPQTGVIIEYLIDGEYATEDVIPLETETTASVTAVSVDHNTGGADNLRYVDTRGNGIDNATIEAYFGGAIVGRSSTSVDGRWSAVMMLDPGFTYQIKFYKQSTFQTTTVEITI
jgi:hypothetical protein